MTHSAQRRPLRRASGATTSGDHTTPAGTRIPSADLHARRIAREAGLWRTFAGDRTQMLAPTLDAKALDACAFSVLHRALSFAVPSKLVGTSHHQRALWALAGRTDLTWAPLDLEARGGGYAVLHDGQVLGRIQPKHLGWLRPLVPFGLAVFLSRITGTDGGMNPRKRSARYRLGCNVAFGHVGDAVTTLLDALGAGDGSPAVSRTSLRLVVPAAPSPPPVPIRPEREAVGADPSDVVLWRTLEGEAHASVPHVPRHSPSGIEWGYGGSGPADLARSILLALTDVPTADALYQQFKHEVIATVPEKGGVLRAADVRAWVEHAQEHAD